MEGQDPSFENEDILSRVLGKKLRFICPVCNAIGKIKVDKILLESCLTDKDAGLMEIQIFAGEACEHEFRIMVDTQLKVRSSV
ncbi:MAG: hypothetical protein ACTSU9_06875 [Promethearchaeota archaeon]